MQEKWLGGMFVQFGCIEGWSICFQGVPKLLLKAIISFYRDIILKHPVFELYQIKFTLLKHFPFTDLFMLNNFHLEP